jgi:oxygen-independent coproporphyrinogen-3 oxidase
MCSLSANWRLTKEQEDVYFKFSNLSLPRHTSYPAVPAWQDKLTTKEYDRQIDLLGSKGRPISLYVHIPFCEKLCSYCACNRLILKKDEENLPFVRSYLDKLGQEISHNLGRKKGKWQVAQLHLGGGTPTYLTPGELDELLGFFAPFVEFTPDAELAVEIDPRVTTTQHLEFLRGAGFNRVSLGVQDFNHDVQAAIHRIQPFSMVKDFVAECRRIGFSSINFDLIYGLPLQTVNSIQTTLEQVIELSPDRIAYYRLALMPELFKWQRTFSRGQIPEGKDLLTMFLSAINFLTEKDYQFVGLDHFVKPDEALQKAAREKTLRRSFQGMTTGAELPIVAFGPSAISSFPKAFIQRPTDYYQWIRTEINEVKKGMLVNEDDLLHRWVIETLYCYRRLDKNEFRKRFDRDFDTYFATRNHALQTLEDYGLLEQKSDALEMTEPLGALLLRVVASVFDAYLPDDAYKNGINPKHASKIG